MLDLGVGAQIAVFDEPGADFRLGPGVPDSVGGREIVVLDQLGHLITLKLSVGLDDVMGNEPVVEFTVGPRRPDVILNGSQQGNLSSQSK